ncbi:MAG: hypothetical protein ABL888_16650, partial [Pirellulaceae bacterium]
MRKYIVCIVGLVMLLNFQPASAQLLDSRINVGGPTTYGPCDPETRGNLYRHQVGHAGRFYNCDGEENKRCSPYIYWTSVCNQEQIRSWNNVLKCDIREVKQRVRWGSCQEGCDCDSCETTHYPRHVATERPETPALFLQRGYASANPAAVKAKSQS